MTIISRHFKWHHLIIGIFISILGMLGISLLSFFTDLTDIQIQLIIYFLILGISSFYCLVTKRFKGESFNSIRKLGVILLFLSFYVFYLIILEFFK